MEHWLTPLDGSCYGWSVTRKTKTSLFLRYHLPAILYAAAILAVSCIPNLKSPEIRFLANDKVAHFLEYAVFAFLAFRSLAHLSNRSRTGTVAPLTLLLLAGFAVVDELLQGFIPGRHTDIRDFAADLAGGALVVILLWLSRRERAGAS
jgi:VanZ family protein